MKEYVAGFFLLVGSSLMLLSAIGMIRMPDLYTRMQAATKATTLGLACLLIGAVIQLADFSSLVRAVLISGFIMLTSPVSTHVIARAAYLTHVPLWKGTVVDEWREDAAAEAEHANEQAQLYEDSEQ